MRQLLGAEKVEDLARARNRIAAIGEAGDLRGAFKQEGQVGCVHAPLEGGVGVTRGLHFAGGEVLAGFVAFGFDDAHRRALDEEQVIGGSAIGRVFAYGDAQCGAQVEIPDVLNHPPGMDEFFVDLLPGFCFR